MGKKITSFSCGMRMSVRGERMILHFSQLPVSTRRLSMHAKFFFIRISNVGRDHLGGRLERLLSKI